MTPKDSLIAAIIIFLWGVNFFAMHIGLGDLSPMVLGMMRFALLLFPALFFVKKPPVKWYWLAAYGLAISFSQFSLTFTALSWGMPTGLMALLAQGQAFFTVLMAAVLWREPLQKNHLIALLLAVLGLALIGYGQHSGPVPLKAMWPAIGSAAAWGMGNIIVKYIGRVNAMSLVIWGNISSLIGFTMAALCLYGSSGVWQQLSHLSFAGFAACLFLAYGAGLIGYSGWGSLLARYPAGKITPLSLLVPVIALLVAKIFLDEQMNAWHWSGVVIVMIALLVHVFSGRVFARKA